MKSFRSSTQGILLLLSGVVGFSAAITSALVVLLSGPGGDYGPKWLGEAALVFLVMVVGAPFAANAGLQAVERRVTEELTTASKLSGPTAVGLVVLCAVLSPVIGYGTAAPMALIGGASGEMIFVNASVAAAVLLAVFLRHRRHCLNPAYRGASTNIVVPPMAIAALVVVAVAIAFWWVVSQG